MSTTRIRNVCVLGERVSGTSFLQKLITENTKLISVLPFGHKHFFQDVKLIRKTDTKETLFVFISRDLIDWLNSFLNNTFHADNPIRKCTDMSTFLKMEWKCIYDKTSGTKETDKQFGKEMMCERNPANGKRFDNVISMRNAKMKHFLGLKNQVENFVHLKYEDVRDNPEEFLDGICKMFGITRNRSYVPINTVRGKGKIEYHRKMYPEIKTTDMEFILDNVDSELESKLEYV